MIHLSVTLLFDPAWTEKRFFYFLPLGLPPPQIKSAQPELRTEKHTAPIAATQL